MQWSLTTSPVWDEQGVGFSINDGVVRVACRISREVLETLPGKAMDTGPSAVKMAFDVNLTRIVDAAGSKAHSIGYGGAGLMTIRQTDFD